MTSFLAGRWAGPCDDERQDGAAMLGKLCRGVTAFLVEDQAQASSFEAALCTVRLVAELETKVDQGLLHFSGLTTKAIPFLDGRSVDISTSRVKLFPLDFLSLSLSFSAQLRTK